MATDAFARTKDGEDIEIDLDNLVSKGLVVQANAGGGKSGAEGGPLKLKVFSNFFPQFGAAPDHGGVPAGDEPRDGGRDDLLFKGR